MVTQVANRMKARVASVVDVEDLESGAALGFLQAVRRYEPTRGVALKTFASMRMVGAMRDELRETDWAPRLARARKEHVPVMKSMDKFVPDARYPHESPEAIDRRDPHRSAAARDFWSRLRRILSAPEVSVIELYYLGDFTLKEIGQQIGLSESRCCQLLARAHARLRKAWA